MVLQTERGSFYLSLVEVEQEVADMDHPVNCPKCRGYMYSERFADFALTFFAWKCINCGTVVDTGIIENKNGQHVNQMNLVEAG